jgi:two-component system heavy metal sensor histidine kinase CusS
MQVPAQARTAPQLKQLTLTLTGAAALALALLAAVVLLAVQMHFEAGDRQLLLRELEQARQILAGVDDTAALAQMPAQMADIFDDQPALAVRIQGPLGQPLYEKLPKAAMPPALLAQPALAPPAPLVTWQANGQHWRGSALVMRMPMDGAAPLTVAVARPVDRNQDFMQRLRLVLTAYVLLAALGLAALIWWACRRALTP